MTASDRPQCRVGVDAMMSNAIFDVLTEMLAGCFGIELCVAVRRQNQATSFVNAQVRRHTVDVDAPLGGIRVVDVAVERSIDRIGIPDPVEIRGVGRSKTIKTDLCEHLACLGARFVLHRGDGRDGIKGEKVTRIVLCHIVGVVCGRASNCGIGSSQLISTGGRRCGCSEIGLPRRTGFVRHAACESCGSLLYAAVDLKDGL